MATNFKISPRRVYLSTGKLQERNLCDRIRELVMDDQKSHPEATGIGYHGSSRFNGDCGVHDLLHNIKVEAYGGALSVAVGKACSAPDVQAFAEAHGLALPPVAARNSLESPVLFSMAVGQVVPMMATVRFHEQLRGPALERLLLFVDRILPHDVVAWANDMNRLSVVRKRLKVADHHALRAELEALTKHNPEQFRPASLPRTPEEAWDRFAAAVSFATGQELPRDGNSPAATEATRDVNFAKLFGFDFTKAEMEAIELSCVNHKGEYKTKHFQWVLATLIKLGSLVRFVGGSRFDVAVLGEVAKREIDAMTGEPRALSVYQSVEALPFCLEHLIFALLYIDVETDDAIELLLLLAKAKVGHVIIGHTAATAAAVRGEYQPLMELMVQEGKVLTFEFFETAEGPSAEVIASPWLDKKRASPAEAGKKPKRRRA